MTHRGGFATGNDQPVDGVEFVTASDGHRIGSGIAQRRQVFAGVALQCQHPDPWCAHCCRRPISVREAGQPLLHDGSDHLPVLVEDLALAQRATAAGRWRGLVVEQPLVGPEHPHEPHRVVQRRHLQMRALVEVSHLRRSQQGEVAHVGQRADMQHRVVGQRIAVPEPHLLLRSLPRHELQLVARHDADVPLFELLEPGVVEHLHRLQSRQVIRRRRGRHHILVVDALLIGLE